MSHQEGKFVLESVLGKLLGFDEGAGDLLNHLLTMESEEDLKEYLSQLLGSETPETKEFVMNLGRYQRGEEVLYTIIGKKDDDETKAASFSTQASQATTNKASNNKNNNANNKKQALQARKNQKQGKKGKVPPPSKKATAPQQSTSQSSSINNTGTKLEPLTTPSAATTPEPSATQPPPPPMKKSIPQRGKAKLVCGCMGNRDKPLTNCLYCGRIVCEREGYGYCPYCGYLIEELSINNNNNNDASWAQKERLLRFDREFARRTKIFDDQADFQGPVTWMSEEERAASEQKQMERLEEMRRPKQVMNLNI